MNGNSSAHQHKPITGTQISSCLRKNLRNGIRRLSWYCSTRISTQLWWLLVTKYECCLSKPLSPATSQCVRPTRFIQNLLIEIQASALACIKKRRMRCTSGMGTSSFTSARIKKRPTPEQGIECQHQAGKQAAQWSRQEMQHWGRCLQKMGPGWLRSTAVALKRLIPDLSTPAVFAPQIGRRTG